MSWNPQPTIGGAQWPGNQVLATRKQLLSTSAGILNDIQDINLSSINVTSLNVSTLTAQQWISTPELYVSSILGGGLQVNDGFLQISTGNISLVSLSTLQFKGIDLGGVSFNFDLGLGNAIGGFLGGLGALVGGVFIGLGTGTGLAIQGITNGLFSLANTQGGTQINNNVFETINGSTQLQISTLGNEYPFYSSIFRTVSSVSANSVPGQEIFVSTIFPAGTTAIRSVSDPLSLLTNNSTINTSTIQSFGEWVPFLDPTVAGEDIIARNATFSTITVYPPIGLSGLIVDSSNAAPNDVGLYQTINMFPLSNSYNVTSNNNTIANNFVEFNPLTNLMYGNQIQSFISTPYTQYTSTIGNYVGGVYFIQSTITSSLTSIPKFTYNGSLLGGANFAICEPDESGFLSTATMDFVAQSSNVFIQWGLAAGNFNSTIAQGTGKRVTWNIPANTSNFIDIPVPQSTILSNTFTSFELKTKPLEMEIRTIAFPDNGMGDGKAGFAFDINRATFGAGTTFNNVPNYPYQFNNNVYVNGILEADEIIALSSFTSTNIVNFFSTTLLDADEAFIEYCQVSTLYSTDLIGANEISTFGIENYSQLSQFSFVSTLVVDLQILEGTTGGTTATITKIQANSGGSFVKNYTLGSFSNLSTNTISTGNLYAGQAFLGNPTFSTINLSTIQEIGLTSIYNYPGAITAINTASGTTAPVVAIGFKAQINLNDDTQPRVDYNWNQVTATSNGVNYFPLATFDETLVNPYVWTLSNIATATFSNATIDNAFISTLNLSSVTSENASFSNINISTLNNQNTNTLLQYLATPNSDFATTGSPGVWLTWFDIGQVSSSILSCPSFDINLGTIAMGADNPPNGGMSAYLGVREKGQGNPITYKIFENRTIYAGNPALYGGDVTLALRRGTDYSVNASTLSVWVYGAANNPYFRIGGYASNCFIRGYPY